MEAEGRVVVLVTPDNLRESRTGIHAARVPQLGLTAYGDSVDEALRKLKRMYASAVEAHRQCGTLTKWLDDSGLTWCHEHEYTGLIPIEDAKASGGKPIYAETPRWEDANTEEPKAVDLPLAA